MVSGADGTAGSGGRRALGGETMRWVYGLGGPPIPSPTNSAKATSSHSAVESGCSNGTRLRPGELGSAGAPRASSRVAEMSRVETTRLQRLLAGSAKGRAVGRASLPGWVVCGMVVSSLAQHMIAGTRIECS